MLGAGRPPRVVQLKTFIAEAGSAVGTALGGLQGLGRFAELAHHRHAAQVDRVSVPERARPETTGGGEKGQETQRKRLRQTDVQRGRERHTNGRDKERERQADRQADRQTDG